MTRVAWATDIHLNFLENGPENVARLVQDANPDALLIGGDIAEAPTIEGDLRRLAELINLPIYFVLGNHDFYRGSLVDVRERVAKLVERIPNLFWLPRAGVIPLSDRTALIGHECWSDGRNGVSYLSQVQLTDFDAIEDFRNKTKFARFHLMSTLGDEAAIWINEHLPLALAMRDHVVLLTHVPPFPEACWYNGELSSDQFLPHFTCKAVGDVLHETMRLNPTKQLMVLCGHIHGTADVTMLPNLRVITGGATYGTPEIQGVFDL